MAAHSTLLALLVAAPRFLSGAQPLLGALRSRGGCCSRCTVATRPDGVRGLFTTRAVDPGDMLVQVPARLALATEALAMASPLGPWLTAEEAPEHHRLACALLLRKAQGRIPTPFMAALPTLADLRTTGPTWLWEPEELRALCAPALEDASLQRKAAALQFAASLRQAWLEKLGGPAPGDDEVQWALAVVTTRSVEVVAEGDGGQRLGALVPVVDMMNHDARRAAAVIISLERTAAGGEGVVSRGGQDAMSGGGEGTTRSDAVVALRSAVALRAGEEVCFSYGDGLNDGFLLWQYGFLEGTSNPHGSRVCEVDITAPLEGASVDAIVRCLRLHLLRPGSGRNKAAPFQPAGPRLVEALALLLGREEAVAAYKRAVDDALERCHCLGAEERSPPSDGEKNTPTTRAGLAAAFRQGQCLALAEERRFVAELESAQLRGGGCL